MMRGLAETLEDGETVEAMSGWARTHGITLVGGSIVEQREAGRSSRTRASSSIRREIQAVYRKIHMFDVEVGGQVYRESETEEPGEATVTPRSRAEARADGLLRPPLPRLYRVLAVEGAEVIWCPPRSPSSPAGPLRLLLRARAVENQCYVVAANQWGSFADGKAAYGRSLIADPWGVVLAEAPDEDCVISAEIDRADGGHRRLFLARQPPAGGLPLADGV